MTVAAAMGCSSDNNGGPADASQGDSSSAAFLSFSTNVYGPILNDNCVGCHSTSDSGPGPGAEFGHLDMSSATLAYGNLVGDGGGVFAAGSQCADSGIKRVVPADPTHSLIYNKVASNAGDGGAITTADGSTTVFCGHPMPLNGPALVSADLSTIRDWIQQGAKP